MALLAVILLVARSSVIVSVLTAIAAGLGVAAVAVDSKPWKLPADESYGPWIVLGAFGLFGLITVFGLRRVKKL